MPTISRAARAPWAICRPAGQWEPSIGDLASRRHPSAGPDSNRAESLDLDADEIEEGAHARVRCMSR